MSKQARDYIEKRKRHYATQINPYEAPELAQGDDVHWIAFSLSLLYLFALLMVPVTAIIVLWSCADWTFFWGFIIGAIVAPGVHRYLSKKQTGPLRTPAAGQSLGSIGMTDSEDAYHPRAP